MWQGWLVTGVWVHTQVVYISCNPETLARDLTQLRETHRVHRFATFDQFPYTDHLESGAFLVRK